MLKLNTKGFAHLLVPVLVVVAIGVVGGYVMIRNSNAATITQTQCKNNGGVWLDLSSQNVDHSPCWSNPGAYLVNWGAGKVGDGIDHIPATGNNAETGNSKSEKFDYPNYIIVVGQSTWQACGDNSCTAKVSPRPFSKASSTAYRNSNGGKSYLSGGAYNICQYAFFWYSKADGSERYSYFCKDQDIYLARVSSS